MIYNTKEQGYIVGSFFSFTLKGAFEWETELFSFPILYSESLGKPIFSLQNLINSTFIQDEPRYAYRGVMLDSSRHFLAKKVLLDNLDLMEMNKLNVFHWHLTDDNSFPFVSQKFPNLRYPFACFSFFYNRELYCQFYPLVTMALTTQSHTYIASKM